jgi:hypothetical protein
MASLLGIVLVALPDGPEKGVPVWLNTKELQAKPPTIPVHFPWNRGIGSGHDCKSSHSWRRGQPAATQALSSSTRHRVDRPMRIGCGILPAASQVRQVRVETAHRTAAAGARSKRGIGRSCLPVVSEMSIGVAVLSMATEYLPISLLLRPRPSCPLSCHFALLTSRELSGIILLESPLSVGPETMAARRITAAGIKLFHQQAGGDVEEVGEVLFSRIPVRSPADYRCILAEVLDLRQAQELSQDIQRHARDPQGTAAGYVWRR